MSELCYMSPSYYIKDDLVVCEGRPPDIEKCHILTMSKEVYGYCCSNGITVSWLNNYLGFRHSYTIFDMYILYFDGKEDDTDILKFLLRGCVFTSETVFCMELFNTFCWFTVKNFEVNKLGVMSFGLLQSEYSCGTFLRRLRHDIVSSGYSLKNVVYLSWNEVVWGNLIKLSPMEDMFHNVRGFEGLSCKETIERLGNSFMGNFPVTAETFVDALSEASTSLKLREAGGTIRMAKRFYKDYSLLKGIHNSGKYGIVLDCEGLPSGVVQDGCREVGGIIFSESNGIMLNRYTFIADSRILGDTLVRVIEVLKSMTKVGRGGVDTYVFGVSDIIMLRNVLDAQPKLKSQFNFIDSTPMIRKHVGDDFERKGTLNNLAGYFNVHVETPKHNALNDARTLFNILAHIRRLEA